MEVFKCRYMHFARHPICRRHETESEIIHGRTLWSSILLECNVEKLLFAIYSDFDE